MTMIQPGQALPDLEIKAIVDGQIESRQTASIFGQPRLLLFAVPGAFTPTCSNKHLPGYVQHFAQFRQRGVEVVCMAVNDAYVMQAWARDQKVPAGMVMLADGNGSLTRALGLELDGAAYGMGLRSRRFALYAEDGVVRQLHVEAPGEFRASSAEAMLAALDA